jgi:hypothetical protein
MTMLLGMTVTKLDESGHRGDGADGPAYLLTSHCGAVYGLYRMPAEVDLTRLSAKELKAGRFPILGKKDGFTDRGGVLRILGR